MDGKTFRDLVHVNREHLNSVSGLLAARQGNNPALTVLYVPSLLDISGFSVRRLLFRVGGFYSRAEFGAVMDCDLVQVRWVCD